MRSDKAVLDAVKLSPAERQLITTIFAIKTTSVIERKSDKEFDIHLESHDGTWSFAAWLPLATIRESTWTRREIAEASDYPGMVLDGDWSGIRDSSEEKIWNMFRIALDELKYI